MTCCRQPNRINYAPLTLLRLLMTKGYLALPYFKSILILADPYDFVWIWVKFLLITEMFTNSPKFENYVHKRYGSESTLSLRSCAWSLPGRVRYSSHLGVRVSQKRVHLCFGIFLHIAYSPGRNQLGVQHHVNVYDSVKQRPTSQLFRKTGYKESHRQST